MRIGFLRRGHSATGGAEAYLLRLASALREGGDETVLVTTPDWPAERWPFGRIVRVAEGSPEGFAEAFRTLETGCDVHFSLERVPGASVFRAGDGVHAEWLRTRDLFEPFWKRLTRHLNPKHRRVLALERAVFDPSGTRAVVANSHLVRDQILANFPYPAERIHVIPNGIGPAAPAPPRSEALRRFGLDDGVRRALFLGTGWKRKGLETALRAVAMMENTELLVAGRGPADLYRGDAVRFLGPVADLPGLFAAADMLVLPTWYDPFSNACLEALAAGLPVLTTPSNGFSEIITPGVHGEIVEAGDDLGFAEAMAKWSDQERLDAAASACRDLAKEYSIARNAAATREVMAAAC
jgi:UDP-glucose:(heptosyl)LPS alpha-1,3-glucosyltransferase